MFFRLQVFQGLDPGFRSSPKVDRCFKLFTFMSWYLCLQFFFFFKYQHKKIYAANLIGALKFSFTLWFLFSEKFFYLLTEKISYCEKFISHVQTMLIFIYEGECVLIFLNIRSIFVVQTSFLLMLVEKDHNLIIAKMFCIQLSLKKVFGDLRFNLLCYMYILFILYWVFSI